LRRDPRGLDFPADALAGAATPRRERPNVVGKTRVIPTRLEVPEQYQRSHIALADLTMLEHVPLSRITPEAREIRGARSNVVGGADQRVAPARRRLGKWSGVRAIR
jgi:hypothetical protein